MAFGRLERHAAPEPMSEINVTPLVDVMLVLLVIFIVTAPLLTQSLRLDLPRTGAAQPGDAPHSVAVSVDREGRAFIGDQPMADAALRQRLIDAARLDPATEVQLRADAAVPYGRIVELMGAAHEAGLHRIGFVAAPAKP